MNNTIKSVREIRESLVDLQARVNYLMEDKNTSYRELDIVSQKLEEAIMWTYRVVALEKINEKQSPNCCVDNTKPHYKDKCTISKEEDFDVDRFIKLLTYFNKDNFKG